MNIYIKLFNIEWRTPYPLTNFADRFWIACLGYFFYSNMRGVLLICTQASSLTLVVNLRN